MFQLRWSVTRCPCPSPCHSRTSLLYEAIALAGPNYSVLGVLPVRLLPGYPDGYYPPPDPDPTPDPPGVSGRVPGYLVSNVSLWSACLENLEKPLKHAANDPALFSHEYLGPGTRIPFSNVFPWSPCLAIPPNTLRTLNEPSSPTATTLGLKHSTFSSGIVGYNVTQPV